MNYLSTDFDAIKKSQVDLLASEKEKKKNDVNALYDSQTTVLNDEYGHAVDDTKESYVDDYQKNAVQKLINERQVAESMSNLGLTDSGLNRTQQTAVQLSYANQKGKLDRQKQKTLDELSVKLASDIATIEQNRLSDLSQVDTDYEELANSRAAQIYKDNVEANTAMYKAQQEAAANSVVLQHWNKETNDDGEMKFIGSDGSVKYVTPGKNPYTNSQNAKVTVVDGKTVIDKDWQTSNKKSGNPIVRACANYGVFSNGYQPKGVCYLDDYGRVVDAGPLSETNTKQYINGNLQKVWKTENTGQLWIWDGSINEYRLCE